MITGLERERDIYIYMCNHHTPTVIGSTVIMASPLLLQPANPMGYDDDPGSLPDHLVSDAIT